MYSYFLNVHTRAHALTHTTHSRAHVKNVQNIQTNVFKTHNTQTITHDKTYNKKLTRNGHSRNNGLRRTLRNKVLHPYFCINYRKHFYLEGKSFCTSIPVTWHNLLLTNSLTTIKLSNLVKGKTLNIQYKNT